MRDVESWTSIKTNVDVSDIATIEEVLDIRWCHIVVESSNEEGVHARQILRSDCSLDPISRGERACE